MENLKTLANLLLAKKLTVATAESCTGGLIAKTFTDLAGSSGWFESGVVSYSNSAKERFLNVPGDLIREYGAVSEPVALKMAQGVRSATSSSLSVSTSGIAGPGGGSQEKPVGTVCFGFCFGEHAYTKRQQFSGNREEIRKAALDYAINELLALVS